MSEEIKPDMTCFPYRRKKLYLAVTIPLLLLYILIFIYLWSLGFILSLIFLFCYLTMCFFMAYCCVYQECPYVGGFCPGAAGLMPASLLAKLIYHRWGRRKVVKSKRKFDIYASIAFIGFLGMPFFPLYWIAKLGILYAVGYFLIHILYYLVFLVKVCEVCAIRRICPGGRFRDMVFRSPV